MTTFHLSGKELFASQVDLKRAARQYRRLHNERNPHDPIDLNQAIDFICKLMGVESQYAARQKARDPDVSGMDTNRILDLLRSNAVREGTHPDIRNLPSNLGKSWLAKAKELFATAAARRSPGELEFIVIAGGPSTGKTLLGNAICADRGGYLVDSDLQICTSEAYFEYKPGSCLIYDRSAKPDSIKREPADEYVFDWNNGFASWTLSQFRQRCCPYRDDIPEGQWSGCDGLRQWVKDNPLVLLVITFPSIDAVKTAVEKSPWILGPGKSWSKAHVVDLESMKLETLSFSPPSGE